MSKSKKILDLNKALDPFFKIFKLSLCPPHRTTHVYLHILYVVKINDPMTPWHIALSHIVA